MLFISIGGLFPLGPADPAAKQSLCVRMAEIIGAAFMKLGLAPTTVMIFAE